MTEPGIAEQIAAGIAPGYYWIKRGDEWFPAQRDDDGYWTSWCISGSWRETGNISACPIQAIGPRIVRRKRRGSS